MTREEEKRYIPLSQAEVVVSSRIYGLICSNNIHFGRAAFQLIRHRS